jgi:hypothetical protein
MEINYDAILPTSRRPLARSLEACTEAIHSIHDDLEAWGGGARARGTLPSASASNGEVPSIGVAGETGLNRGLAGEMGRKVMVIALTPTKQVVGSTLGREVSWLVLAFLEVAEIEVALVLLVACYSSFLNVTDDSSA